MDRPVLRRKVFDCFLYNGELDVLCIRLNELREVVHRFVVVESDTTFSGQPKTVSFDPLEPRIAAFAENIRHVVINDMPKGDDPWRREAWQRDAILRGVPDADATDLIVMSDVDEIPRAATIRELAQDADNDVFGLRLAFYYFFVDYRNVDGPEAAITWTVAAARKQLEAITPNNLRYGVRSGHVPARIVADAGWHFSYLTDEAGIRRKIAAFSHQEFNNENFLSSIDIVGTVRRSEDLFNRAGFRWSLVDSAELPAWLQGHRRSMSRLFFPRTVAERLQRRLFPATPPATLKRRRSSPPVIICPYLYDAEPAEMRAKFGLDKSHGRRLKFFMWQDVDRKGPERAFEHCWNQFPDKDIIIVHSDMAPMPEDKSNRWYDALLEYRDALPDAGMIACNLFYPRLSPDEPLRVQCAGGTFHNGKISHLRGPVVEGSSQNEDMITTAVLQQTRAVEWVTMGGVLIRREVIRACGPFDPRYQWAYVMDVDYSFEARLRGYRLFQVPVSLQHEASRTARSLSERKPELLNHVSRNFELFYEKWQPFTTALSLRGHHKTAHI